MADRLDELVRLYGIGRDDAERLEVVSKVLAKTMTLEAGAAMLKIRPLELQRVCNDAHEAIIKAVSDDIEENEP